MGYRFDEIEGTGQHPGPADHPLDDDLSVGADGGSGGLSSRLPCLTAAGVGIMRRRIRRRDSASDTAPILIDSNTPPATDNSR